MRHNDRSSHRKNSLLELIQPTLFQRNDVPAFVDDCGLGVDGIAVKDRRNVTNRGILERFESRPAYVRLAHPDHQADDYRAFYQSLPMLRACRKIRIDVHGMLIHAQQTEQGVVELGNRAPGPVSKCLARFKILNVASVRRQVHSQNVARRYIPARLLNANDLDGNDSDRDKDDSRVQPTRGGRAAEIPIVHLPKPICRHSSPKSHSSRRSRALERHRWDLGQPGAAAEQLQH